MNVLLRVGDRLGPLLAGWQVFAQLTTLISLGALGEWIMKYWIPATRAFWSWVFTHLPFHVELTSADKDALTGIAFFLPMALATTIRLVRRPLELFAENRPYGGLTVFGALPAVLAGATIIYVVSQQMFSDYLLVNTMKDSTNIPTLAETVLRAVPLMFFMLFLALAFMSDARELPGWLTLLFGALAVVCAVWWITSVAIYSIGDFHLLVSKIGAVRYYALIGLLLLLVYIGFIAPKKIFVVFVVVAAFLAAAYSWLAIEYLRKLIESTA